MLKMFRTKKKGFTLVELMIVVAIIGILAAIAIPAFLRYIKSSKTAEAEATMKKMSEGAKSYFSSEQRYSPSVGAGGDQPWHVGNGAAGASDSFGMPVDWTLYAFPGGAAYIMCSTSAGAGSACAVTDYPTGGSKKIPGVWVGAATATLDKAVLNKLKVGFEDPTYFAYEYESAGVNVASEATIKAYADFNLGAPYHTVQQSMSIDSQTQDVQTTPAFVINEFE